VKDEVKSKDNGTSYNIVWTKAGLLQ